jgi:probable blue pigment (indigoidine) exporter
MSGSVARVAGATVFAPISWGTTYATITELLPDDRPLLVAALRVGPAGLALVLAGALSSHGRCVVPPRAEWGRIAVLALFNFGLFFPLLFVAAYRLPGGTAAAAGGLLPLAVAALSWALTRRRPRRLELLLGIVAVIGVGLVVVRPGAGVDAVGIAAAVAATLSFAGGVVLTKHSPAPSNRYTNTGWQLLLGAAVLGPVAAIVEGAPPRLSLTNVVGFGYLSLVGTALAYLLWFRGIGRLPTSIPPLLALAAPMTGAAVGWVVLDQSLSPAQVTGFALIVTAIAVGARSPHNQPDKQPETETLSWPHTTTPTRAPTPTLGCSTRTASPPTRGSSPSSSTPGLAPSCP